MCRFVVYKGPQILLSDLLIKPQHSLIRQSYCALERTEPLNGDGFGVGWYVPQIAPTPGLFTSITPAWANQNLRRLADKVMSSCIFAHVRAATGGLTVSEYNCHPFQYERFLWMHNGEIRDFDKIKRRLRDSLRDSLYNFIQGTTDSEYAFALFLNHLPENTSVYTPAVLKEALLATIRQLDKWSYEVGCKQSSTYNFAVTDGHTIVVSRYISHGGAKPESLYYFLGGHPNCLFVASEPLTDDKEGWKPVPPNQLLVVDPSMQLELSQIS